MLVLNMPSRVDRHVSDGVAAMLSGKRFQVADDCIAYKLDNAAAIAGRLKRSSTREFSDITWSVAGERSS